MVDDDPDVIAVTADMFDLLGFDVTSADCPHTALELLRAIGDRVRLIFTDMMMPDMDGNAFADAARIIAPAAGIMYTSGQMPARDNTVFVSKPYTSATVAEAVQRALAASALGATPHSPYKLKPGSGGWGWWTSTLVLIHIRAVARFPACTS